jgi:hypothetical protein
VRPAAAEHPPDAAPALAVIATDLAALAAAAALTAAVIVIAFGVIATSGTFGVRMAWLLGVAMPLLAVSTTLSWLARRTAAPSFGRRIGRPVFLAALSLFSIPFAFAVTVLAVYAFLFVHDALTRL